MFLSICQEAPIILPALFLPKSMLLLLLFHWIFIFIELPFAISLSTSTKVSFLLLRLWRVTRMTMGTFSTDGFDDGYGNRKWSQTLFRARECHPRFLAAVAAFPSTANRVVWRTGDYGSFRWVFFNLLLDFHCFHLENNFLFLFFINLHQFSLELVWYFCFIYAFFTGVDDTCRSKSISSELIFVHDFACPFHFHFDI